MAVEEVPWLVLVDVGAVSLCCTGVAAAISAAAAAADAAAAAAAAVASSELPEGVVKFMVGAAASGVLDGDCPSDPLLGTIPRPGPDPVSVSKVGS